MEIKSERIKSLRGGKGHVDFKYILSKSELKGKCRLYAQLTLEPNCSIGYHVHNDESETYYILSGKGIYDDNGISRSVQIGDVTYTGDGCGHALSNSSDENLVFMALIILEK